MTVEIPLTQGYVALVDDEDADRVRAFNWFHCGSGEHVYATRKERGRAIMMHRFILNAEAGQFVDHINHNALDNRRSNLRVVSQTENLWNARYRIGKTGYRGIHVSKQAGAPVYRARFRHNGKDIYSGPSVSIVEAAKAYDELLMKMGPGFVRPDQLNFPSEVFPNG